MMPWRRGQPFSLKAATMFQPTSLLETQHAATEDWNRRLDRYAELKAAGSEFAEAYRAEWQFLQRLSDAADAELLARQNENAPQSTGPSVSRKAA